MNKTQLKQFATKARRDIEQAVRQKAYSFGITKESITPLQELEDGLIINGTVMGDRERKLYTHLKNKIALDGYEAVMSEAAYTWFNRFVALRYMEVNNFLPIGMRILSSEKEGKKEPDALTDVLLLTDELDLKKEHVYKLKEENQLNNLYQYLLIQQSNKLGDILPNVFEPISDAMALLLPDNLLNENSVIRDLLNMVDEDSWKEVEIVGWLYQFYISEEKESFFSNRSKKADKEDIPAATQLFTPKWIVKYMVDNSLGKYWLESYSDDSVRESLDYLLESDNGEQLEFNYSKVNIEELSFLDPSCGSGHILVYAFDVYYKMYLSRGYREREIPKLILENNLFGLDIDKRAAQLATFALVMKAREYDRRLFSREYTVHIHSIEESNSIDQETIQVFSEKNKEIQNNLTLLIETFIDAKLYGSIIQVPFIDTQLLKKQIKYLRNDAEIDIFMTELIEYTLPKIEDYIQQYELLSKSYDVVVTNPPYMNNFNKKLKDYVTKNYSNYKKDLFSVFIYRCSLLAKDNGYTGFMTPMVWMFISSYEKLRDYIIGEKSISSLVHLEYSAFEDATVPLCTFVLKNRKENEKGTYIRLTDFRGGMVKQENKFLEAKNNVSADYRYEVKSENFSKIPGSPIAYWASDMIINAFKKGVPLSDIADPKQGLATADNDRFIRMWYEINNNLIGYSLQNRQEAKESKLKWFPYNKVGAYRKWYGNYDYVVNWETDGFEIRNFTDSKGKPRSVIRNPNYYFRESITWSLITSGGFSIRYREKGSLFDVAGMSAFTESSVDLKYLLGLLSTPISNYIFKMMNPTLNLQVGNFQNFPVLRDNNIITTIVPLVEKNIRSSRSDWDSFETSWDFEEHPFLTYKEGSSKVEDSFNKWEEVAEERFYQLKENEEELNRIFIDIYGLQDELTPEVEEKDVTVRKADRERDVKSFLSYLVGLMFGRYSLDKKGLAYAGGDWDNSLYTSYQPDETNIIPLTEDQYFNDDIMNKVEELLTVIYGEETLEENLTFIAEALTKKPTESSRDRIRRYFMKEFYKDHLKIYQKRPIYWQFTSGKRGAFRGLMYLHRYHKHTIAQLRTDYVLHEAKVIDNLIQHESHVIRDESSTQAQKSRAQKLIDEYTKDRQELAQYDQVIDHVAKQQIDLDLDDGVKVNYEKFQNIEITDDSSSKTKTLNVFEKL
ncbi:BREX-1 system adenine-specific DNA-methyltransferase PglX [Alkalibacterium indicireducens]|uniref:site-specific DNA-methyltransferase (adenine-specific) n=1 Tax=Alkalibacterium indicireducens TaxID=398758 RepID=A0ABP3KGG9_9LACT